MTIMLIAARYIFLSFLEFSALIVLSLTIFGFKLQYYKREILFTSLLMSVLSFLLYEYDLLAVMTIVQIGALILLIRNVFKEKNWLYSTWVVIAGNVFYVLIQTVYVHLSVRSGFFSTFEEATLPMNYKSDISQVICSLIAYTISVYIMIMKQGFAFGFRSIDKKTTIYFHVSLFIILILSAGYTLVDTPVKYGSYYMYSIAIFTLFCLFLYFSYRRNSDETSYHISKFESKNLKGGPINE
ncbi:hypothetical protein PC41400_14790 [Paenibacillus chitinolyticus]|uniref:Uncharacterized protein n=1 Tax=Paenibacillus chitinolyticus TaxID=79263 RepID=A0A410WWK5_9BACL|nr:hypothetical protein PC41400_14790 [Paenibacillus chitinolyticus]